MLVKDRYKPSKNYGHNAGMVLSNVEKGGLRHVEMLEGRVAPPAVVVRQGVVRRAEIGSGDGDGARQAPPGFTAAPHFIARAAHQPVVEEGRAQCGGARAVALTVQIAVSTCPSYTITKYKTKKIIEKCHVSLNFHF